MTRRLPTFAEIHAARKVIYKPARWREIQGALVTIDGTMHISGKEILQAKNSLPAYDHAEAARQCRYIAQLVLDIRDELQHVHINAGDKKDLRAGLANLASSLQARAAAWQAAGRGDIDAQLKAISTPYRKSAETLERVQEYLR